MGGQERRWSTVTPEERQAARERRALAREVLTPAQLEVICGVSWRGPVP